MASPSGGLLGSSMETAHSCLSPKNGLETGTSSPYIEFDLPSLIADIWGRYVAQDSMPLSPSPNQSSRSPTGSDPKDVMPIAAKGHTSAPKVPCVSGAVSRTRARRPDVAGPSVVPPSSHVPKTRFRVKPFSKRKLLKEKMVFPSSSDSFLTTLWSKIDAQG
ncbi:hypothetical protein HAX54_014125 [Datura stramonium]|uniref:Uncharacterized protein n=1 Tax=Datura stramonium TaxID=4076 RepID=A0ABS8Y209_DATST|nr:hypothetical protein [Datura stramonium]